MFDELTLFDEPASAGILPGRDAPFRRSELIASTAACNYHFVFSKKIFGGAASCGHQAYRFRVNFLLMDLCICHASQMALRRAVSSVDPVRAELVRASCGARPVSEFNAADLE